MENLYYQRDFNNFELLSETAKAWQLDISQLEKGPINSRVSQIIDAGGMSAYFFTNRTIKNAGAPPKDMWTLQLSSPTSAPWLLGKREISGNAITVYKPGYDFDCVFRPGYESYSFSITPEKLYRLCDQYELPGLVDILDSQDVFECSSEIKFNLWHRAREHSRIFKLSTEVAANLAVWHDYETELLRDILLTLAERTTRSVKYKANKVGRIIGDIDNYMRANQFEIMKVSDLCQITQTRERTLQYNFRNLIGLTPKAYLKAVSLNRVRKDLCNRDTDNSSISDIANKWGFWHMGQFAADYRRMFGELPSESLKRVVT